MSLLGIDVGSSVCKAAAFSEVGECLALHMREYDLVCPGPGQAELPIRAVWDKVKEIVSSVAASTGGDPISAICVSSMGEAVVPVTRRREILADSIMSVDVRGMTHAQALESGIGIEAAYLINGNIVGPNFSLPKLMWIRDNKAELYDHADYFLSVSECIAFLLGAGPVYSESQACRTLLYDVYGGDWSDALFDWSGLDRSKFAPVVPGGTCIGQLATTPASELGLTAGIPIVAGGHDQCPTALGCGCVHSGMAACGLGTFQCISPIFEMPDDPLAMLRSGLNIENHVLSGLYIAFIYNQAGSLVKWFRNTFATDHRDLADIYDRLNLEIPPSPTNLLVLPHFDPPQWPTYVADSSGAILDLKTKTTRGEILKGIMECASLYLLPGVDALRELGQPLKSLVAVGGGAKSDAWVQINADIFGLPVIRPRNSEAGLVGAAMLAGMATGVFQSAVEAADRMVKTERVFEPNVSNHEFYVDKSRRLAAVYPAIRGILS